MENKRNYLVGFGDSDKYIVSYEGSKEDFLHSAQFHDIERKVYEALKQKFPTGGYEGVVRPVVEEAHAGDAYAILDRDNLDRLADSVKRQVEVEREDKELNNNAPYDQI